MTIINDRFISFGGEPIPGRVLPRLVVYVNQVQGWQLDEIGSLYLKFCMANAVSVADYQVLERRLVDGTRVRMTSINSIDTIQVWPPAPGGEEKIPHGFAIATSWADGVSIYGKDSDQWDIRFPAPQFTYDGDASTIQVERVVDGRLFILPVVIPYAPSPASHRWDWAKHVLPAVEFSDPRPVPVPLQRGSLEIDPHDVDYAIGDTVYNKDGVELYRAEEPPHILLDEEDLLHQFPANIDVAGSVLVLNTWRQAVISQTAGIVQFRFCSEALQRVAAEAGNYLLKERQVTDILTMPSINSVVTVSESTTWDVNDADLNRPFLTDYPPETGFSMYVDSIASMVSGAAGVVIRPRTNDFLESFTTTTSRKFPYHALKQGAQSEQIVEKIISVPVSDSYDYVSLATIYAYPVTDKLWRNVTAQKVLDYNGFPRSNNFNTGWDAISDRIDSNYKVEGRPYAELRMGWCDLKIFEGDVTGEMSGKHHKNTTTRRYAGDFTYNHYNILYSTAPFGTDAIEAKYQRLLSDDIGPILVAIHDEYASTPTTLTEQKSIPRNSVDYELTSRFIIDYDHKAHFYAAIKVVVKCHGAKWAGSEDFPYILDLVSLPTYDVTISFESNWSGVTAERELLTASAVMPGFDFRSVREVDVWRYPATETLTFYMPPTHAIDSSALGQLGMILNHQGVNQNLAVEQVMDGKDEFASVTGLDFSFIRNNREIPHGRHATGLIYARTFTVGEISGATWLLTATRCDASFKNLPDGEPWYYMPQLGDDIANKKFHIELRDGVLVDWSDELEDAPADKTERIIKMYQV